MISTFAEILKEIAKEEQAAAKKAVKMDEFQGEWTAPIPEFTVNKLKVWTGLKAHR